MIWKRIRLEVSKTEAFPNGSLHHGYDVIAPLGADGVIGEGAWRENTARATVRRFWQGEPDVRGRLTRTEDGGWVFEFDEKHAARRLDAQAFKVGDVVALTDAAGAAQPFRVAAVRVLAMA